MPTRIAPLHPTVSEVTERIRERSARSRAEYLARIAAAAAEGRPARPLLLQPRPRLRRGPARDKAASGARAPNLGIVTAYNDMLSAHQPFERFPRLIKQAAREAGGIAQVAGGVPAMCDGVTQGQPGMELSLFSRDVIAHGGRDRALAQHVRRRGLPRHLRQDRAGPADRRAELRPSAGGLRPGRADDLGHAQRREGAGSASSTPKARSAAPSCSRRSRKSITAPGTCTFYGTANSNQMLMEIMGLHLPGATFVNPNTPLRDALTASRGARGRCDHRARQRLHAGRRDHRRARDRQRRRRPARHRRLDQPHHPPDRHGARRRHLHHLGGLRRPFRGRAAAGARLSERRRRREPFPRRRRHGLPDPRAARRGPAARGCADRPARRPARATPRSRTWRTDGSSPGATRRSASGDATCCAGAPSRSAPTAA